LLLVQAFKVLSSYNEPSARRVFFLKYQKKKKTTSAHKKMSSIPSGGSSQRGQLRWACLRWPRGGDAIARNRFITVWIWIGSRVEHKFTWLFFCIFFGILAVGFHWYKYPLVGTQSILPKTNS